MTYATIFQSVNDEELAERVTAAASKEAWASPEFYATSFGEALRGSPHLAVSVFMWPIAIDNEAAYEYAVNADNPAPGADPGVISDAAIQSGIQTHWPPDPE